MGLDSSNKYNNKYKKSVLLYVCRYDKYKTNRRKQHGFTRILLRITHGYSRILRSKNERKKIRVNQRLPIYRHLRKSVLRLPLCMLQR
jgi:hypothetical protein